MLPLLRTSSRILLSSQSSLQLSRSTSPIIHASFTPTLLTQIRTKFSKPKIPVQLLKDVPGFGISGEIVNVKRGFARTFLVPLKLAYYLPKTSTGKPVFPEGWSETQQISTRKERERVAREQEQEQRQKRSLLRQQQQLMKSAVDKKLLQTASECIPLLASLSGIVVRKNVVAESEALYGSVSADEIVEVLSKDHGIVVEKEWISMDNKIKQVGKHVVQIRVPVKGESSKEIQLVADVVDANAQPVMN